MLGDRGIRPRPVTVSVPDLLNNGAGEPYGDSRRISGAGEDCGETRRRKSVRLGGVLMLPGVREGKGPETIRGDRPPKMGVSGGDFRRLKPTRKEGWFMR